MSVNKPQTRRGFLDLLVVVGGFITSIAVVVPGLMYLWPAARGGGDDRVEVPGADGMAVGASVTLKVGSKAAIVVRTRSGFEAYSAVCTHLGCLVNWDSSGQEFLCPCHAAVFDAKGQVVSGPPPSALPQLVIKEVGDKVFVSSA